MATRKSRQNTESPTPSGTESVPTTPTTPATRNTRSIRNKQLQQGKADDTPIQIKTEKVDEEEAVKETHNDDEVNAAATSSTATLATTSNVTNEKDDTKESTEQNDKEQETSPPAASTRKRRIAAVKEENSIEKPALSNESASPNTPDDGKTSPTKNKRSRRSAFELLTDSKSETNPSNLNKRRNSTGKIEKPTRKMSSRIKNLKKLRKTPLGRALLKKPERIAVAVNKPIKQLIEKQTTKGTKVEKSDSASDSELIKMSRRRSDSVSKCSDMTDASSFHETKGSIEDLLTQSSDASDGKVIVKEEVSEKDEAQENKAPENEVVETTRNANDSGIGGDSDNSQVVKPEADQLNDNKRSSRFSRRKRPLTLPRVMNTRSRSETPSKAASENQDEDEEESVPAKEIKKETNESVNEAPLHIDTVATAQSNADEKLSPEIEQTDKEDVTDDKAKSLSPVLVSEGVSEISVKQFYGQADFLENNLGIEKDPKLGEIVQIHEKIKAGNKENGDTSENVNETKPEEDCAKPEETKETVTEPTESNEVLKVNTSAEGMEVDGNVDDNKTDGAKCEVADDAKNSAECFVKPIETIRRDSATILNENLLVLNGEIELTSTKEKKEVVKNAEEDVGEVVLYKISNGMRVNPEKLEKVLESQKMKEKERSDSIESVEQETKINNDTKIADKKETELVDDSTKTAKDENKTKVTKIDESVRSNSGENKVIADSDKIKVNLIKPAAVRSNCSSKDSRSSSLDDESPEERIQKESHLKTLGLLTHQAAEEATIEKQKQREKIKASKGKKNSEYTGTLKTVIKLHRGGNDKKKGNQSLKMTLHKGRAKNGSDKSDTHSTANSEEDTYYTIQQQDIDGIDHEADEAAAKEHEKLLVIPEKASSFRYHPEKICEDQCFYCGGKFGLFDTPCHIAQIKSAERQKKILEYEEKLTVDSCLCDACFRHVDRRANCPSYKKRLSEPAKTSESNATGAEEDKESEALLFQSCKEVTFCQVHECKEQASLSVCRKWVLKMRRTLNKYIQINCDNTNSMTFLPICDKHYEDINHLIICMLCNRRLKRNHCYFFSQDANKVESLVANDGIQLTVGTTAVACKLCRYYVNLLMRPQEAKKAEFVRDYRKRLLEHHGKVDLVEEDSEDSGSHEPSSKRSKRNRKSLNDHSDCGSSKSSRSNDISMDGNQDSINNTSTRTRQKNKQLTQQQLLEEQHRVEKRVQHEQMKLKQQELIQHQKVQDEIRQQQLRSSSEDISNLRTNPNISMRELFPGEEELGLHVNLPFANSWRTPDGWTKVTSTVQYDEPTKKLWEELEKPYGNQSSFLRHLLLLEKYFRNGDLLLTPNANHNAITYAESVQHRLQAFDNIPPRAVSITQILPQNTTTQTIAADLMNAKSVTTANKAVTISKVSAAPKPPAALSITTTPKANTLDSGSNSLLKSNVTQLPKTRSYTVSTEPINGEKPESAKVNNSANSGSNSATSTPKNKNPGLPPELICITTPSNDKLRADAVPPPSYQLQMQLTLQQQIQQQHQNSLLLSQQTKQLLQNMVPPPMIPNQVSSPKKQTSTTTNTTSNAASNSTAINKSPNQSNTSIGKANVIRLPETLTDAERRESKNWRPTLIAITPENKNSTDGQFYQTVDGRKLPHLVQVMSKGKPYMISIHDYNRMCILHREKLLKEQQSEMLKNKSPPSGTTSQTVSPASQRTTSATTTAATSSNATNSSVATANQKTVIDVDKLTRSQSNSSNGQSAGKVQVPNKFLEQNSLIPIGSKSSESSTSSDSLLRFRFPIKSKSSLLKSSVVPSNQPKSAAAAQHLIPSDTNVTATVIAPNSLPKLPVPLTNALSQSGVVSITSTPSISAILGMTQASTPPPIQISSIIPNQTPPITITNVTSGNQNSSASQSNVSSLEALFRNTNQVTTTPTTMLMQWAEQINKSNSISTPIDNSASSILSKIPKSLTVIPQQKYKGDE